MLKFKIDPQAYTAIENFELPETLGFGSVMAPVMYRADYVDGKWNDGELLPYGPLTMYPTAKVLHYGVELFEGLKAYHIGQESATVFRPEQNWARLNRSAERLCMPTITEQQFMDGINSVCAFSEPFIPKQPNQSLYLRPMMLGTQEELSIKISNQYTFMVIASPSADYHSGDMRVLIERNDSRAAVGGTGAVKVGGNYAAALLSSARTKELGYDQSMWLDPAERKNIEELSGMNFFAIIDGKLHTPELTESLLPGITRNSLLQLAQSFGIETVERKMPIDDLLQDIKNGNCTEAFACGTAAVVTPICVIGDNDSADYELQKDNPVTTKLRAALIDIQEGRAEDTFNWNSSIPKEYYPDIAKQTKASA